MKLLIALIGVTFVIISFAIMSYGEKKLEERSKRESKLGRS